MKPWYRENRIHFLHFPSPHRFPAPGVVHLVGLHGYGGAYVMDISTHPEIVYVRICT